MLEAHVLHHIREPPMLRFTTGVAGLEFAGKRNGIPAPTR
jgi:hypothetical protein